VAVHRRERLSYHLRNNQNLAIVTCRQSAVSSWEHVFIASDIIDDSFVSNRTKERGYGLPLYLYPDEETAQQDAFSSTHRTVNLLPKIYSAICKAAGIDPADQAGPTKPSPLQGRGLGEGT